MPIETPDALRRHLQWALELEHSTIPPYLCALYSIPEGANATVANLIRSVVMEEMLHMTLVANLLNAIGGKPKIDSPKFVPSYPTYLPHSDKAFKVHLRPLSKAAIATFLDIERPAKPKAKPQAHKYHTIGQFYEAILDGFERVTHKGKKQKEIFKGKKGHQVSGTDWYYGGGGEPVFVDSLKSARKAIEEVAEQGEGLPHSIFDGDDQFGQADELAHYFRFNEIYLGRRYLDTDSPKSGPTGPELPVDWDACYPMHPDPKAKDYEDQPEIHRLMVECNRSYTGLLKILHKAFNGQPSLLLEAVPRMYDVKYRAQALMAIPSGRGDGTTVGPSFEYTR